MKKQLVIAFLFCAVASLVWVSPGFSWTNYSGGCGDCHGDGFAGFAHTAHGALDCSACHVQSTPESPATNKCAGCHTPASDPIECQLVIGHADAPVEPISCATCHPACDEPVDECETDDECDDGIFCNGIESCSTEASVSVCVDGTDPCIGDTPECIEEGTGTCVECLDDADCAGEELCEDNVCIAGGCPAGTPPEVLLYDTDGSCLLNKDELKTYNTALKGQQKQAKTDLKNIQTAEKNQYKMIKSDYSE